MNTSPVFLVAGRAALLLGLAATVPVPQAAEIVSGGDSLSLFGNTLRGANLQPGDLGFGLLPVERDSLRLTIVDQVLAGRRADLWVDSLATRLEAATTFGSLGNILADAASPLFPPAGTAVIPPLPADTGTPKQQQRAWIDWLTAAAGHPYLAPAAVAALEADLLPLNEEEEESATAGVFVLDRQEQESRRDREALVARLLDPFRRADWSRLRADLNLLDSLVAALPRLEQAFAGVRTRTVADRGGVVYEDGTLLIGGPGPNVYRGSLPPLVIDLGGDDLYLAPAAVARGNLSLCIDLAGNDDYSAAEGPARAIGGLALLLDLSGNDRYRGGDNSLAAGLGGIAVLQDRAGDDHYQGGQTCQGAGVLGWGLLLDSAGRDRYESTLYAQGYGGPGGVGLLRDTSGSDSYETVPEVTDFIRYEDHSLSLAQGFGYGMRPVLSGGLGLLVDGAGQDRYTCDIYGQGAAYWYALGGLVDRSGGDLYTSWQYAQGAGIHLAVGVLLDGSGSDCYRSHGVAQGCGHDLGLGWLEDGDGEDYYLSEGLSQGAGSANGAGVLLDHGGNDLYALRRGDNSRGYGDSRRNSGSLGLFADGGGDDRYLGGGAQDSLWRGSRSGFGMDLAARPAAPDAVAQETAAAALDAEFDSLDTIERLHVWAQWSTRIRHRWQAERAIVHRRLRARHAEYLPWLAGQLAGSESWERHGIRETLLTFGEDALPFYRAVLDTASASTRGLLLWVLSDMPTVGEAPLFEKLWPRLSAEEGGSRGLCLINLARREKENPAPDGQGCRPLLYAGMQDPDPRVRAAAAWALGQLPGTPESRTALLDLLDDPVLHVRQAVQVSLRQDSLLTADVLEHRLDGGGWQGTQGIRVQRRLLELLAGIEPERALARLEDLPHEPFDAEKRLLRGESAR